MISIGKICIAHYTPLSKRKDFLLQQLKNHNVVACEWFECEPAPSEFAGLYDDSRESWELKTQIGYSHSTPYRKLNKSDISLLYKHLAIWTTIINDDIETCLVLEDDVILEKNFVNDFNYNLHVTPKDWDLIFIGSG